ncbi:MAG: hypothetical protein KAI17_05085, partial [Thiotrichaceae bacterium]|nr:hypothetical protein [Thiotrichaceae bacterium]
CEIGSKELKFNENESLAFLKKLSPQITDSNLQYLQSKTQGWAAGMVLMVEQFSLEGTLSIFDNNIENKGVSEYLGNEILIQIDNELRNFLVQTALFIQFTADMSQELTNCLKAKLFLDDLVTKNFLIERTTEYEPDYIFHPLFRELLLKLATTLYSDADWLALQTKAAAILVKQEKTDEAMFLYQQLHEWPALKKLLLNQSDHFIKIGRHYSVKKWMEALPAEYLEEDAWLNYWYAVALKSIDPVLTSSLMEQSYHQFIADNDILGVYSAWQAAVDSICISMDDYSNLNTWLTRFDDIRHNFQACPSLELKARFYATAVQAFSIYNPQHPCLKGLVRICEYLVQFIPIKMIQMMVHTQLAHYYALSGQIAKLKVIAPYLELAAYDNSIPVLPRIMNTYLLGIYHQYQGEGEEALKILNTGLELSKEYSINIFNGLIYAHIVSSHICKGDLDAAQKALQQAIKHTTPQQRMQVAYYHSNAAWVNSITGEYKLAFEHNEQALQLTQQISVEIGYVCSLAIKVQLLLDLNEYSKAEQVFSILTRTIEKSDTYFNLV